MSICLTRFPISGLGEPKTYQNLGDFTMCVEFYLEVFLGGCNMKILIKIIPFGLFRVLNSIIKHITF